MIKHLAIRNFQSLAKADFELGRFTVIVGETDVGKSAIIRAIRYLATNQSGHGFVTHGQTRTGVQIDTEEGATVAWRKSKTAVYKVRTNGAVEVYQKMGTHVPLEVASVLRIGEVTIGDDVFLPNFHGQFDMPFLITSTSSSRARMLGEVSGANILYLAIQEARRRERTSASLRNTRMSDLERAKEVLKSFEGLEAAEQTLNKAAALLQAAADIDSRVSLIAEVIEGLTSTAETCVVNERRHKALQSAQAQMKRCTSSLKEKTESAADIRQIVADIGRTASEVERLQTEVSNANNEASGIKTTLSKIKTCPLCRRALGKEGIGHLHEVPAD